MNKKERDIIKGVIVELLGDTCNFNSAITKLCNVVGQKYEPLEGRVGEPVNILVLMNERLEVKHEGI